MVDARLKDGSRVNAIIPPLAIDGPMLSIRRFAVELLKMEDLIAYGSINKAAAEVMRGVVTGRLNVLISGGTGAGKTTLLNVLSGFIPETERIVTIEDSAELQLQQPHVVRLETRPPNIEGKGEINQRDLVRNSLRMRPDRIVLGEVRGPEALDMLQAMNTGHDGSLTTVHANTPRDALGRIENMVSMTGINFPTKALREQIAVGDRRRRAGRAPRGRHAAASSASRRSTAWKATSSRCRSCSLRAQRRRRGRQRARRAQGHRHRSGVPQGAAGQGHRPADRALQQRRRTSRDGTTQCRTNSGCSSARSSSPSSCCRRRWSSRSSARPARRASGSMRGSASSSASSAQSSFSSMLREKYLRDLSPFERALEQLPGMARLTDMIEQAGLLDARAPARPRGRRLAVAGAAGGWIFTQKCSSRCWRRPWAPRLPFLKVARDRTQRFRRSKSSCPKRST